MRLQLGLLALWVSTAIAGTCQPGTVEGPYTAQNVAFDVICGQGLSGTSSYQSQAAMNAGTIEECMVACAQDPSCLAITWDNIGICNLFSVVTGSYSDYTDTAIRQQPSTSTSVASSTTSSAAATSSAAPECQAGTYTSSIDNVQFNTACGRHYVGTEISNGVAADLQGCMDMCASDLNCVAVSLSYSGNVCHLFSHTDYSTPDASWDLGVVSSRPSSADSTSSTDVTSSADSTSSAPAATSSTPPACQDGTYSGTTNQFTITCDASPNGYQTLSSLGNGYTLETCLQACDVDSQCDAAVFAENSGYCIVYQGALSDSYLSVGSDYIYKMPASSSSSSSSSTSISSTTPMSSTSSTTSSSASSTSSAAPLTCAQLGGTYTGASNTVFEITCEAILGGSPSSNTQANSFEQCMDLCQIDSACLGVSFFGSMNRCYTFDVYIGSSAAPPYDAAIIPARLPSTSSTSSADSTSTSATSASSTTVASVTETFTSTSSASTSTSSTSSTSTSASSDTSSSPMSSMTTSSTFTSLTSAFTSSSATSSQFTSSTATLSTTTSLTTTTSTPSTTLSTSTTLPTSSEPMSSDATSWSTVESRTQSESQSTFLSTYLSTSVVSESTLNPTTSASAESSPLSSILTPTATLSIETSTILTSASTENPSSETSSESTTVSLSSRGPEASSSSTSQATTETESTAQSSQQQTSPVTSVSPSESSTSASLTSSTTSSAPSASPRNIQVLDGYDFIACLRSDEGFPTFTEVATQANMTTEICVKLAAGSIYVGVYEETCYKADSLDGSEIVEDERCSLRCPGDPTVFCGGTTGGADRRRAIPSNRLLTIYRQEVLSSSSSSSAPSSRTSQASGTRAFSSTSASTAQISYTQSVYSSSISSPATSASSTVSESGSVSSTPFPTQPGSIRTIHVTKGVTYTEIVIAETVTTVTYVTINPSQPGVLITTCIPVTLQYTPCNCDHQEYPPVDMTTIISSCDACGFQGQDVVTMVVPVAACETGSGTYNPAGWIEGEAWNHGYTDQIEGHQVYTGNAADVKSQPQPTQGGQSGEGSDYENRSDIEAATEGSGGEAENKQPANPQPTQGKQNGKGPDYQNGLFSTQAAIHGPGDEPPKGKTAKPLPTQGKQNSKVPDHKNGQFSTQGATHGPGAEASKGRTASPQPTQGQQNGDRPGDEKDQSPFTVRTSADDNSKNRPIVSASQPSSALNPSKSLPPQDQRLASDSFPTETSVVSAPAPDTFTNPPQSVPVHGHHPAVSTTFATEVDVTKEAEAPDSTYRLSPLRSGESSSSPSLIPSSEACRNQVMYWSMMVVIVGVVLVF
ncbi:probable MUC1-Extracellular alpha-1,4-glucan glucosidase [Fusarium fujikuroi]|nr:probable MUC1-Extracellular alpha-1,4-glucan glucosidase [Fusarium fujikuroi]